MTTTTGGPLRILIVDDEPDIVNTLADGLELCGEITYPAHDATAALRLTEEFAPDVALLDIGLPDIDGFELARRLHARHGKQLVLIAITGYGDDKHKARAQSAGFDAFLVKPAKIETVRNEIRRLIEQRQAAGQRPSLT
jgi:DNA-binding response OmpR family regulator